MSFQGDVAGVGLAELLQSLARSEREGVLYLETARHQVRVGLRDGQVVPLPSPDETPEQWDERVRRAWLGDLPMAVRERYMAAIARATRIEAVYSMLEVEHLHFKFTPGPLPLVGGLSSPTGEAEAIQLDSRAAPQSDGLGAGIPVEFFLLEHARLNDEHSSQGGPAIEPFHVPMVLAGAYERGGERALLEHCDGQSTLAEIGDRLGLHFRQTRSALFEALQAGQVRLLDSDEILGSARAEFELGRMGRAADRLAGWIRSRPAGPFTQSELDLVIAEWQASRLPAVLSEMLARDARALLRLLERALEVRTDSVTLWEVLREGRRTDGLATLHCAALRCAADSEIEGAVAELLRLASSFREKGHAQRASTVLRLAAAHSPERLAARIELGQQMLQTGMLDEGSSVLIEGSRELLAEAQFERAGSVLQGLLKVHPENTEAQGLLVQSRTLVRRRKRRRTNKVALLSTVLVLGAAALVKAHEERDRERRLASIQDLMHDPKLALQTLQAEFGDEDSPDVQAMRGSLDRLWNERQVELRTGWMAGYDAAREECMGGDPLAGFRQALDLAAPPDIDPQSGPWPTTGDLLNLLGLRLENNVAALDPAVAPLDVHAEERLSSLLADLLEEIAGRETDEEIEVFETHVELLRSRILRMRDERARLLEQQLARETLAQQDQWLEAARAFSKTGELQRSIENYENLLAAPDSETLLPALLPELRAVRDHKVAIEQALAFASAGDHAKARKALEKACPNPREHLLPWRVQSRPSGARARFPDGSTRLTPFVLKTGFGEPVEFDLELDGCEKRHISVVDPGDLVLEVYRKPESSFSGVSQVDAAPIPLGEDYIVADRRGDVVRLGTRGEVRWKRSLSTLGGIARTPAFLPSRPGFLLVLSEDGEAWILESSSGVAEGPWAMHSPPVEGPVLIRSTVGARFIDGRIAIWRDQLEPEIYATDPLYVDGSDPVNFPSRNECSLTGSLCVLRRSIDSGVELVSPWTRWLIVAHEDHFEVTLEGAPKRRFTVSRKGLWRYVGWEQPNALVPEGRLWISDGDGLRTFLP